MRREWLGLCTALFFARKGENLKKFRWPIAGALLMATLALASCRQHLGADRLAHKLIILGIDGMDPQLLRQFMAEGKMPNFASLAQQDAISYGRLYKG